MRRTKSESEETRRRILDAAETVFLEIGVSMASLDRIAKEAGVTRGAVYWHFSDKSEIFTAMVARVHSLHKDLIENGIDDDESEPFRFIAERAMGLVHIFESNDHARKVYKIIVTRCEYVGNMRGSLEWQRTLFDAMASVFRRAFDFAEQRHMLHHRWTSQTASMTFQCFMSGMLTDWLRYDFDETFSKSVRSSVLTLLDSFRADAEPASRSEVSSLDTAV